MSFKRIKSTQAFFFALVVLAGLLSFLTWGTPEAPTCVAGDANRDGQVNIVEVVLMVQHSIGSELLSLEGRECADLVKGPSELGGNINVLDILGVMDFIMRQGNIAEGEGEGEGEGEEEEIVPLALSAAGVPGEPYDFRVEAMTVNGTDAETPGTNHLTFMHRSTLQPYTAEFVGGFAQGETRNLYLGFPDDATLSELKWMKLHTDSTNGWQVEEIQIYDANDSLYFEMDVTDGNDIEEWIDGQKGNAPYYKRTLLQILPQPASNDWEREVMVKLVIVEDEEEPNASTEISNLEFRFYPSHDSTPEVFVDSTASGEDFPLEESWEGPVFTLSRRLGEYSHLEIHNTDTDGVFLDDVQLWAKHADGTFAKYFERDINDGHDDYEKWVDGNGDTDTVIYPLLGGSMQHAWSALLDGTAVRIESHLQGAEIWGSGVGAAEGSFIRTVQRASAGTDDDPNIVDVALYKSQNDNNGAGGLMDALEVAANLNHVEVRYLVDVGNGVTDVAWTNGSGILEYGSNGSVFIDNYSSEPYVGRMHNKFVSIRQMDFGPTVLYGSCNLGSGSHGRYQAMTQISGIEALWLSYNRYFTNMLKYHPDINLAQLPENFYSGEDYFQGTPNDGAEFSEEVACGSEEDCSALCTCSEDLEKRYHELGSDYDTAPIVMGNLKIESWFFPRLATSDAPLAEILIEVNSWLNGNTTRRAEIYFMHMIPKDKDTMEALIALHQHPRADVLSLSSVYDLDGDGNTEFHDMHYPNAGNYVLDLENARYSTTHYQVHAKWVAIKKWHLNDSGPVDDEYSLVNGSMNVSKTSILGRDENLTRVTWSADTTQDSINFEKHVYQPYVDFFSRAYNSILYTDGVGAAVSTE